MIYFKRIIISLITLVVILFASFMILYTSTDFVNDSLSDYLNSVLYGKAEISFTHLSGSLFKDAEFENLEIVLKSGLRIRADYMRARFDLRAIIDGRYHVSYLYADSLNIDFTDKSRKKSGLLTAQESAYFDIYKELDNTEIVVNRLEVRKGRFRFSKTNEGVFENINFDGHFIFTDEKIDVKVNNLKSSWAYQDDVLLFKTHAVGDRKIVQFNQTEFRYNQSSVIGKFLYKFNEINDFNVFVDQSRINSKDIKFISPQFGDTDFISFNAQIDGNKDGFNSILNLDSANYKNNKVTKSLIESYYNFDKSTVNVFKSDIKLNGGQFQLNGELFGENGHKVIINFQKLDLNQFGISIDKTDFNGKAILDQTQIDFSGFSNTMNHIELYQSSIGNINIKKSNINFDNDASGFYLKNGSSIAFDNNSDFNLKGNISPETNQMSVEISTDSAEISALMSNFGVETIKGKVKSKTRVYGKISNPRAFVNVVADSLKIINGFVVYDAQLNMVLNSLAGNINGTARLTSDSAIVAGNHFKEFDVYTKLNKEKITIENVSLMNDTNGINLSGLISLNDSIKHFYIDTLSVQYQDYKLVNTKPIHFNTEDGGLFFDEFKLFFINGGEITVDGIYNVNNYTNLNVSLDKILIDPFNQLINYEHNLGGIVKGDIHFTDFKNLTYNLNASVDQFIITPKNDTTIFQKIDDDTISFGKADLRFTYSNNIFDIETFNISDDFSQFNLNGLVNTSYLFEDSINNSGTSDGLNLKTNFQNLDLNKFNIFIGYYKELNGFVEGLFEISGTIKHPKGRLSFSSDKINVNQLRYKGEFNADLDKDKILINNTRIQVNETKLDISGFKLINLDATNLGDLLTNGTFDLTVLSKGDTITSINSLIPDIRAIYGKYDAKVNLVGTINKPSIKSGRLTFTDARVIIEKLANPLIEINNTISITNGIMRFIDFKANSYENKSKVFGLFSPSTKRGVLRANGKIDLNNLLHPVMDLNIKLDKFFANYHSLNAQVYLTSNNLKVYGRDTVTIKGDLDLTEATIRFDFQQMSKNFYESTQSLSDKYTIMDFNIVMRDNVRIYNDDPTSTRSFDMYLTTPNGQPMNYSKNAEDKEAFRGYINIDSGTFTFIRPFEISKGIINLSDQDNSVSSFNPKVEFESKYESDEYIFGVSLNDYLNNLSRVQVTVALANNPNQNLVKDNFQIVNLLLFGEEDFNEIGTDQTLKNVLNIFASEQIDIIQEINIDNQKNPEDPQNKSSEYSLKFKTRQLQIYESWKVQAVFNSNNQSLFDLIETSVRVYDNLVIYLARDQSSDFSTTQAEAKYNLRLQWYYEF